jgi:hypothetical protein
MLDLNPKNEDHFTKVPPPGSGKAAANKTATNDKPVETKKPGATCRDEKYETNRQDR